MINIGQDDKRKLMRAIFGHINALPQKDIHEAVVLVSFTDDHKFAFHKITGKLRMATDIYPFLFTLEDGIKLIDPTSAFLKPQADVNFVTMHYVMRLVRRAKFVFVFNSSETDQMPFDNIKKLLVRFISMFNLSGEALTRLIESCGIMITDAKDSLPVYYSRLAGKELNRFLLDDNYLSGQAKQLAKGVLEQKRVLLSPPNPKNAPTLITNEFVAFAKQLSYFDLADAVSLTLESKYSEYVVCEIYKIWEQVFKMLYSSIDSLAAGEGKRQSEIFALIKDYDMEKKRGEEKVVEVEGFRSIKLLHLLNSLSRIIMKFINNEIVGTPDPAVNQLVVGEFLQVLYASSFLKTSFIRTFLNNYFLIRKFLSKQGADMDSPDDLFHRINFCDVIRNVDVFHPKMREISLLLLRELQSDLAVPNKAYPYGQCLNLLNSILDLKDVPQFTFLTDRVTKKLLKCRASIAYNLIRQGQKNKKDHLATQLDFLRWSSHSKLIKDKLKTEILIDIALKIAQHDRLVSLALEILNMLPEFQIYKHVRSIYENQLKLNVQVLEYLPEAQRKQLLHDHFEGYYTFFLKIGFQETVREMSMECLRLADNEEDREYYKNALVKARGHGFRDLHNAFLENSILQEKEVNLTPEFINHIEEEMKSVGLL